jgi:hypothetical protein
MTIHQIAVFLENKYGKLSDMLALLGQANINILAATIADTSEYGIFRMIVTEPEKAYAVLKSNHVSANLTDVLAIAADPAAGCFAETFTYFTQAGLSIEYMYTFILNGRSILVIRTNNREAAREVVRRHELDYICENDLIKLYRSR